mmetsp:Transcript_19898/g.27637  ORF Transcript_19898/g.27637 Transcript_19898/m.27637 type:complete len:359 (+) Transcript_19898:196-1272(+)
MSTGGSRGRYHSPKIVSISLACCLVLAVIVSIRVSYHQQERKLAQASQQPSLKQKQQLSNVLSSLNRTDGKVAPSGMNSSQIYALSDWQTERFTINKPLVSKLLTSGAFAMKRMEAACGCKLFVPDSRHSTSVVINGTLIQRNLMKILILSFFTSKELDDNWMLTTDNSSDFLNHPFVDFADIPASAVPFIHGRGMKCWRKMCETYATYVYVDEDNTIYGNKKRVFVVSYLKERRDAVIKLLEPFEILFRDYKYRWSYSKMAFVSSNDPVSEASDEELEWKGGLIRNRTSFPMKSFRERPQFRRRFALSGPPPSRRRRSASLRGHDRTKRRRDFRPRSYQAHEYSDRRTARQHNGRPR